MLRSTHAAALAAGLFAIGCSERNPLAEPSLPLDPSLSTAPASLPINVYGLGPLRRATPLSPCATGHARDFDFWLGEWQVVNPAGVTTANSRIAGALDGCAVLEFWFPIGGIPGRSLNGYDADEGVWRQTWVPAAGRPFRMAGGLDAQGVMRMTGTRIATNGFHWIDTYAWTATSANHVDQAVQFDLPEINLHLAGSIPYDRVPSFTPGTLGTSLRCINGDAAETRALDFTVGRWRVVASNGLALGTSDVSIDPTLSGCLLEEIFTTPKGYESRAFLYYDPVEDRYYRSSMDSEGNWVELRGAPIVSPLVLAGTEALPGRSDAQQRLSWEQVSADHLRQTWSVSTDGGATWGAAAVLDFLRM